MKKKISIEGMTCVHCVNHTVKALKSLGAEGMDVNYDNSFIIAEISKDITDEAIKLAIKDIGYHVVGIEEV
jgi:copper chaperone